LLKPFPVSGRPVVGEDQALRARYLRGVGRAATARLRHEPTGRYVDVVLARVPGRPDEVEGSFVPTDDGWHTWEVVTEAPIAVEPGPPFRVRARIDGAPAPPSGVTAPEAALLAFVATGDFDEREPLDYDEATAPLILTA
ncbi:MAG: hypothetical protein AAF594_17130, partial [Bacteroidota bacterium]